MSLPSSPITNVPTVPSWYVIVAVRFEEKSSGRAMTSLTASQVHTAWKPESPIGWTAPTACMRE